MQEHCLSKENAMHEEHDQLFWSIPAKFRGILLILVAVICSTLLAVYADAKKIQYEKSLQAAEKTEISATMQ